MRWSRANSPVFDRPILLEKRVREFLHLVGDVTISPYIAVTAHQTDVDVGRGVVRNPSANSPFQEGD